MVVIRAHFDGRQVVLPTELRGARPGEVLLVFESDEPQSGDGERCDWMNGSAAAFSKVWDNKADQIYDKL